MLLYDYRFVNGFAVVCEVLVVTFTESKIEDIPYMDTTIHILFGMLSDTFLNMIDLKKVF